MLMCLYVHIYGTYQDLAYMHVHNFYGPNCSHQREKIVEPQNPVGALAGAVPTTQQPAERDVWLCVQLEPGHPNTQQSAE